MLGKLVGMNWSAGAHVSKKADPPAVIDNGLTETVTRKVRWPAMIDEIRGPEWLGGLLY